jgi:hypothetical protein
MKTIEIIKASGEREAFDLSKLKRSLQNAEAGEKEIESVVASVSDMLHDGITTKRIYREAYKLLRKHSNKAAGRYKLKEAIFELGPTGFPFERFVAEILNRMGYETEVGTTVKGDCVNHEVDIIASKDDKYYMIECKFHNRQGLRCNVHVPLYIQSRFLDVKRNWVNLPGHKNKNHQGWVITNTRFTKDAEYYGECIGLKLLSWDYPNKNGLKDLIPRVHLHPITCLSALTKADKELLLNKNVIFCNQISENKEVLNNTGIEARKIGRVFREATDICNTRNDVS